MTFRVVWEIDLEADNALEAAQAALEAQRRSRVSVFDFNVTPTLPDGGSGSSQAVRLPEDNPLGRPLATVCHEDVCCGHCGSVRTYYVEDVGQYAPMWSRYGIAFADSGDLEPDEDGNDPRVWCLNCNGESVLPLLFQWAA
jgi:hypothetical protein